MRTFSCTCEGTLFYDNTRCVACGTEAGFCPACQCVTSLIEESEGRYRCANPACCASLRKCDNYRVEQVCNRCIVLPVADPGHTQLCDCCRYNTVIPNLANGDNRAKWRRLESAKRRLFYHLDLLGLPRGTADEGFDPPLSFMFKEEYPTAWNPNDYGVGDAFSAPEPVMTGHLGGTITINLREADPAERERLRVQFGEHHRSLIGHFRHEMAHYYWDLLIKGRRESACQAVFGDPYHPTYADALQRYYQKGPPFNWAQHYTSAYASMHPWEDFAETFSAYLEMVATLDTVGDLGLHSLGNVGDVRAMPFDDMCATYARVGIAINELNRTMGLKDLLTRPLTRGVLAKMRYIHGLITEARSGNPAQPLAAPKQ